MAAGTNVYAVSSDTASAGKSHIVVHIKSTLAEQTTPVALVRTDVSKSVSAVSFSVLDLEANNVALAVVWTPPDDGSVDVGTNVYAVSGVSSGTDFPGLSHVVVCTKSTLAEQTTPAYLQLTDVARVLTDVSKNVPAVSFVDLDLDENAVPGRGSKGAVRQRAAHRLTRCAPWARPAAARRRSSTRCASPRQRSCSAHCCA